MTLRDIWSVLLTAILPVLEIRGALPLALAKDFPPVFAYLLCVIGNMLPVPFVILLARRILKWMKNLSWLKHVAARLEARAHRHRQRVLQFSFWGLMILVAIPLPGTGAWTGGLIASLLGIRLKKAFPAIVLGMLLASVIMSVITYVIPWVISLI